MGLASLAFLGLSVMPLLGALQKSPQQVASSPGSSQDRLEIQAKGYELVLQREPQNQAALKGLLEARVQQGNIKAVIPVLEKLAEQNADQPDYKVLLAQAKQQAGDREGAAEVYRSVLEKRPGDINALKGLSDLLIQQERPEAAIGLLQDTLKTADEANRSQPGSVDTIAVQVLLGEVFFKQKRYDEAIATYDQAVEAAPQDFRPVLGKALVLQSQDKNDEAAPLFASAEALAPAQYKDQIKQLASTPTVSPSPAPAASGSPASGANAPASPSPEASPSPAPAESAPATE